MAEENRIEGEDIIAFLIAKYGVDKTVSSVDEYASKQGGRYRFQEGKQDLLIVQAPKAVRNDKFTHSNGIAYMCKLKEVDILGAVSPAEQTAILTEVQLFELLGQVRASIGGWNPLADPGASIVEGLTITADTSMFKDKQTQEERTKTRFSVVRNEAFNRKLIEAMEISEKYHTEKQITQAKQSGTAPVSGNAYSV